MNEQSKNEKLTVAIIGCGRFARNFVNLFKFHPNTNKVYVCDIDQSKAQDYSQQFDVEIISSFEEVLERKDINCIANFTQRQNHGSISIAALKHGKHVYSAVPMASTVEECKEIVRLVEKTGLTYVMGETCYYYPCAMFCREAYKAGKFGKFYYGASQYYHHIEDISYGKNIADRGMPPMLYPSHSIAMLLSAVDAYATKVSCFGCREMTGDSAFLQDNNEWGNEFVNQYAMMQLSNGGTARIIEARGFGYGKPSSYISGLYGSHGSYEFSNAQHLLSEKVFGHGKEIIKLTDISDYVNPSEMVKHKDEKDFKEQVANGEWQWDFFAKVQQKEVDRLPIKYATLENGHMGSHKFLIDDFMSAAHTGKMPVLNAWFAARSNIPGLVAIESAKQGGIPLDVPDMGDAPKCL